MGKLLYLCYAPGGDGFEAARLNFVESYLPGQLDAFNSFLKGKKWLAGDNLSFVDFQLAETLDQIQTMNPNCFDKHTNVKDYVERFFNLEKIQAYRASNRFNKFPINNKWAQWGGNIPSN